MEQLTIRNAAIRDIEGIKALLRRYHRDTISDEDRPNGFVTTAITDEQLTRLIEDENGVMIITVPSSADPAAEEVKGFCFAAPWDFWAEWPLFRHMMDIIPEYEFEGSPLVLEETYQYGPMCIDTSIRGTGAFEDLFFASLEQFRERFPVMLTFVNQINGRSENAHTNKAHMTTIGTFDFGDNHYFLMGIRTDYAESEEKRDSRGLTEEEFLRQYDPDKYPKPSLTADIVVFKETDDRGCPDVLLIRRKGHPYIGHLALPGGFAESGETIENTAARELEEETGVRGLALKLVGVYSRPGRDPRGWTVSAAYTVAVRDGAIRPVAGDDAREVCWASVQMKDGELEVSLNGECVNDELAFDHYEILSDAYKCAFM